MRRIIERGILAWRHRAALQHKADLDLMLSELIDARHRLSDEIEYAAEKLMVANHRAEVLAGQINSKRLRASINQWKIS